VKPAVLPSAVLLAGLLFAAPARGGDNPCATAGCHESLVKGKSVHAAADSCDSCHEAVSTPHPSKGKKTFKLTAQQPDLCSTCHEAFGKKAVVHSPVKDGTCTTCHDPHASKQAKLLTAAPGELCGTCHGDHLEFKVVHGPVAAGDCMACHTPHESAEKGLLLKKGDAVCFDCHVDVQAGLKKKVVHAAIEGGCTSCHNPHGSANPKLLAEAGGGICFACHDAIGEKVKGAVVHAALKSPKGCASCHSPHAADEAKLLLAPEKDLCLGCHKTILTKAMTVVHGPIAKGRCTPCHDPHGSPNPRLLVGSFPSEPYAAYTDKEFALCFGCHNRDLLRYPDTAYATGFRDGERNLHFLHVNNKQKGRSCRLCHAMHGADNTALIAEKVTFGSWSLPLKFVKNENGGSCAPGCHKPATYVRKGSSKKPEPEAPKPAPKPAAKPG
jgi:predicted CXXCH cytochrome family protein